MNERIFEFSATSFHDLPQPKIYPLTNASINRITSAPSKPSHGLSPSPKKYFTVASIIGC